MIYSLTNAVSSYYELIDADINISIKNNNGDHLLSSTTNVSSFIGNSEFKNKSVKKNISKAIYFMIDSL